MYVYTMQESGFVSLHFFSSKSLMLKLKMILVGKEQSDNNIFMITIASLQAQNMKSHQSFCRDRLPLLSVLMKKVEKTIFILAMKCLQIIYHMNVFEV